MDKLKNMRALVTVAKLGSFSAAARELGVTPGMMSKQIKHLESELDVRLLQRSTRGVSLTDAGELFVDRAIDIVGRLADAESAVTSLASGPRGVLRVSCPPSFGTHVLTRVIAAFADRNPDICIELGLQDDEPDVIAARLDVLFRLGNLRDSSLVAKQVGKASFILCAAPAYVARHGAPDEAEALARHNCIIDRSIQTDGTWEFIRDRRRVSQAVSGNFTSVSTDAVIAAALEGVGIAYVPSYAVPEALRDGALIELHLPQCEAITLPIYALYGSREHVAGKIRTFLAFYAEYFQQRPGFGEFGTETLERRAHGSSANSGNGDREAEDMAT